MFHMVSSKVIQCIPLRLTYYINVLTFLAQLEQICKRSILLKIIFSDI